MTLTVLGWALIHFMWQAAVVALGLGLCLRIAGPDARVRYLGACGTLLLLFTLPGLDAVLLLGDTVRPGGTWILPPDPGRGAFQPIRVLAPVAPLVAVVWLVIVGVLLVRVLGGWWLTRALVRDRTRPARSRYVTAFAAAARRVPVQRDVRLLESADISVPTVIGVRQPVILLPEGPTAALPTAEITSLLAHELVHVRRGDVLANLLQVLIEAALFFHPAVWWVSRTIREERESTCDRMAAQALGNPRRYARALARLEVLRGAAPPMAVAARGGSLLRRLERLTRTSPAPDTGRGRALSAVAAGAGLAAVLSVSVGMMVFPRTVAAMHASPTAPSRYVVHARDDAGPFTVAVAGGRVVRAVIGGVAVPSAAIRQQGDSVVLPSGTGAFTIRLRPGGGFSWSSRTP